VERGGPRPSVSIRDERGENSRRRRRGFYDTVRNALIKALQYAKEEGGGGKREFWVPSLTGREKKRKGSSFVKGRRSARRRKGGPDSVRGPKEEKEM